MNNTNYDRIKNMSLDEMTKFFTDLVHTDIITTADHYICQKCKAEHNGECPVGDDDNCLYDSSDYLTIKLWLSGDTDRAERTKTIVDELRAKPSRDNRNLLDRAADRIEELEAAYENLADDVKKNAARDICDICKHANIHPDCPCDCEECNESECVCRNCINSSNWEWRGENK